VRRYWNRPLLQVERGVHFIVSLDTAAVGAVAADVKFQCDECVRQMGHYEVQVFGFMYSGNSKF